MVNYIQPLKDNFLIRPTKAHFHDCNLLVIVHSRVDDFKLRNSVRNTWGKYITDGKAVNTSLIFLLGDQYPYTTDATRYILVIQVIQVT